MGTTTEVFSWNVDADEGDLLGALHTRELLDRGLSHVRSRSFPCEPWQIGHLEQDLAVSVDRTSELHGTLSVLGRVATTGGEGMPVLFRRHGRRSTSVTVAADDLPAIEAFITRVVERLKAVPHIDPRVPVTFWTMSAHGPRPMPQMIDAPEWEAIAGNYESSIVDQLERAMHAGVEQTQGIALWWGEPGTGKTTALRALARAWKDWCEVHVIIDPEVFLGSNASYLIDVLMSQGVHHYHAARMMAVQSSGGDDDWDDDDDDEDGGWSPAMMPPPGMPPEIMHQMAVASASAGISVHVDGDDDDPSPARPRRMAKLIVLEDAGELVSADARHASGQALSRLLNITDGMLGQGLNLSVLVTTNEQVGDLHPAIQRPGRCWSQVEFPPLGPGDAAAWLRANGRDPAGIDGPRTIAELYAQLRGDEVQLDDFGGVGRH